MSSTKNELDVNYEDLIENLLLQQVLLYARDRSTGHSPPATTNSTTTTALLVQQTFSTASRPYTLAKTPSTPDDQSTVCLMESRPGNSSDLIETILQSYDRRQSNFDHNLIELIIERHRTRRHLSSCPNDIFQMRLQWLAIGLVIDRLFFSLYFTATLISYIVTLWFIPFSHPNLVIDIRSL